MSVRSKKESGSRPGYGMWSCATFQYKFMWKYERGLALAEVLFVPADVLASAVSLYIPYAVIGSIERWDSFSRISLVITGLMLANMLLMLAEDIVKIKKGFSGERFRGRLRYQLKCSRFDRDFYLDYDPDVKKMDERAGGMSFFGDFMNLAALVLKFLLYGVLVSMLSPMVLLALGAEWGADTFMSRRVRKQDNQTEEERNVLQRKLFCLSFQVAGDMKYGKEIRLYHFERYLTMLAKKLLGQMKSQRDVNARRSFRVSFVNFLTALLRNGAVYALLIAGAGKGQVDGARFVLYFTAVTEMADVMGSLRWWSMRVREEAGQVSDYREALAIRGRMNRGEGISLPRGAFSIIFSHVSFRYPGSEINVLNDISFQIKAGERIALVGLNGSGKTTLIRLICGLLLPTEGEILIDGHPLEDYNRDELYTLFGVVSQNYNLLPVSIARNIACTREKEPVDRERLYKCIETAGLGERVASLPLGADTPLNRQVNPEGTELSGGEIQKLLFARLLYRRPGCMILDEPTAALDPIAEDRLYRRYSEAAEGATSVFISHRLASTRFCHRIFLLEKGEITETGTHEELMAAGGRYRELFELQSRYYRENFKGSGEGGAADEGR